MEAKKLSDFIYIYQKFAISENKSNRTIESVISAIKAFDHFLGGSTDVAKIRAEDLRRYIRSLQQRYAWEDHPTIKNKGNKLSPHSIASYVRAIRSFWSWLKREEFISENPFEKVRVPKAPRKVINIPTNEQITKLLKSIPIKIYGGFTSDKYCCIYNLFYNIIRP
ncbi:tyrosine-type recombinase/integrase [Chloroflexota bacterium]